MSDVKVEVVSSGRDDLGLLNFLDRLAGWIVFVVEIMAWSWILIICYQCSSVPWNIWNLRPFVSLEIWGNQEIAEQRNGREEGASAQWRIFAKHYLPGTNTNRSKNVWTITYNILSPWKLRVESLRHPSIPSWLFDMVPFRSTKQIQTSYQVNWENSYQQKSSRAASAVRRTHTHLYVHVYEYKYIYIYIHIFIYIYMYICVHPQTLRDRLRSESIRFFVFFFAHFKQWGYAPKDRQNIKTTQQKQ